MPAVLDFIAKLLGPALGALLAALVQRRLAKPSSALPPAPDPPTPASSGKRRRHRR